MAIAAAVAAAPATLAELSARTGLPRPTAHRIAVALEHHGVLEREADGRFRIGPAPAAWAGTTDTLALAAEPAVRALRDTTLESAQVYRRVGARRLCVAAAEPAAGLRDTVPVGSLLTLKAGSAAQALLAWAPDRATLLEGAAFDEADLEVVRARGWAHSVAQREPGVASLSAPVRDASGTVIAAVSVSGPVERLAEPSTPQLEALAAVAADLGRALRP